MGINSMSVSIWGRKSSRNATVDYMYGLVEDNPQYLRDISPYIQLTGGHTVKEGRDTYRYTSVYGVNEDYTAMVNYTIADGPACSTWTSRRTSMSASSATTWPGRPTTATP